ncbi:MAG TPA: homoserine dehydrogenase [Thermoanaerobaculaceae bacterium]|nr:homoserine dehydrogenase [Thermoanaerobaculaceae bacterium]
MRLVFVGFGTVGQGLAELLLAKRDELKKRYGLDWIVTGIADTLKGNAYDAKGIDLAKALALAAKGESLAALDRGGKGWDALAMAKQAEADVLLEATYTDIKTGEPATSHIRAALERGVHVVTTNKGPLALHYRELAELAAKHKVEFLFEGTVMSGTPVLNLLRETLAGAEIVEMQGILNGTTNYILTRMEEGLSYEDALAKAQELGYAEAVPDADVLGWDALAKVTILANVVFGASLKPTDSPCEGITKITAADIANAKKEGKRYKLIGRVWREGGAVKAAVAPRLVDLSQPLAGVMGATNAVAIKTDALGEVTIVGPGAGKVQTGFSMLTDLLHIVRRRS